MKQNTITFFIRKLNPSNIYVIISLLKRKLRKLIVQNFYFISGFKYYFSNKNLILIFETPGSAHKVSTFPQFLDHNVLKYKARKKIITNRIGVFKTDILEEKVLLKDEARPRIFKKLGKKYGYQSFLDLTTIRFSEQFESRLFISKKISFKNHIQLWNVLPHKNILENSLSLTIIYNSFKNYRIVLKQYFFLINLKNLLLFYTIFNSVCLNSKIISIFHYQWSRRCFN